MLKLFQQFPVTNVESPKREEMFVLFMAPHTTFKTSLAGNALINSWNVKWFLNNPQNLRSQKGKNLITQAKAFPGLLPPPLPILHRSHSAHCVSKPRSHCFSAAYRDITDQRGSVPLQTSSSWFYCKDKGICLPFLSACYHPEDTASGVSGNSWNQPKSKQLQSKRASVPWSLFK